MFFAFRYNSITKYNIDNEFALRIRLARKIKIFLCEFLVISYLELFWAVLFYEIVIFCMWFFARQTTVKNQIAFVFILNSYDNRWFSGFYPHLESGGNLIGYKTSYWFIFFQLSDVVLISAEPPINSLNHIT